MAIVTISRDLGSGGREVGKLLAQSEGYRYIDKEDIFAGVRAAGFKWDKWAEEYDEHTPHIWQRYDWSFRAFVALVQSAILNEAAKDRAVIIGRGGNFLLRGIPFALGVRVVAPIDDRIERLIRRESIDRESALWLIEKTDRERAGFLYTVYGSTGKDPAEYDVVYDCGTMSIEEIVKSIQAILTEKDRSRNGDTIRILELRALAAMMKAELLTRLPFFVPTLDVVYDGSAIRLRGVIHSPKEHAIIETEAKKLAGDVPVACELHYRG